jgi:hypothetical protein
MSLNLLTVPNNYNIFCNSITQGNSDGANIPTMNVTILDAQAIVASPAIGLTSMAIRGNVTVPPFGPQIIMTSLSDDFNNLITMTIPQFSLISWTGSATVLILQLTSSLPAQFLPVFPVEWTIPFNYSNTTGVGPYLTGPAILSLSATGVLTITGNFASGAAVTQAFGPQTTGPIGPVADIYVQYGALVLP